MCVCVCISVFFFNLFSTNFDKKSRHNSVVGFIIGIKTILCTNAHRYNKHEQQSLKKIIIYINAIRIESDSRTYHIYIYICVCVCMMYQVRSTKYLNEQIRKCKGHVKVNLHRMYIK